ncbi:cellulase family glycosylhydrolase [Tautonia plasticadhaerens]|uniref:Cellulase (Glycosyl hydrolase family 5) n=1 Tax=Tautonia plasticadhaerens TaxID=2527974 RepID=A0A518H0Y2_9BACT|nr:cellulase family glycosylhydrolase [Tautonia plasticadhaerens]QDV34490.1 Cellulase (glycosyl hydrolase family 5) [Tautonia plasticadhaerens]
MASSASRDEVGDGRPARGRRDSRAGWAWTWVLALGLVGTAIGPSGRAAAQPGADPVRPSPQSAPAALRVSGRHFVDPAGRVVLLRGVNLSGDSKVPPFHPAISPEDLDRVAAMGFNVIRLLFVWEAYEPSPGVYDESYLEAELAVAAEAARRGISTVVDVHQDGFSRFASRGSGDGFPAWAVSPRGTPSVPDNSPDCAAWPLKMFSDPTTHKSFADFFDDAHGVRTRYLLMLSRVAAAFSGEPGVIGYDPINEPWGHERRELAPLYRDAAAVIRARHPSAILFLEGHITTNTGLQTRLPRPDDGPMAYAPHYYNPTTIVLKRWHGLTATMDNAFRHMTATSARWDAPLFVGEFGMDARVVGVGAYVDEVYDRLDAALASGAQWNLTPDWSPTLKDRWNGEDFSILLPDGRPRPNFRPRPYPRATAGMPVRFSFRRGDESGDPHVLEFDWHHLPGLGETEISLPPSLFPPGSTVEARAAVPGAVVSPLRDPARGLLLVRADRPGPVSIRVQSPVGP